MASETVKHYLTNRDCAIVTLSIIDLLSKSDHTKSAEIYVAVKDKISNKEIDPTIFQVSLSGNMIDGRIKGFEGKKGRNGGIYPVANYSFDIPAITAIVDADETEVAGAPTGRGKGLRKNIESKPLVTPEVKVEQKVEAPAVDPAIDSNPVIDSEIVESIPEEPKEEIVEVTKIDSLRHKPVVKKAEPLKNKLYDVDETFYMKVNGEQYKVPINILYVRNLLSMVFKATEDPNGNVEFEGSVYMVEDVKKLELVLFWVNASLMRNSEQVAV